MISKLKENLNGDPIELVLNDNSTTYEVITQINDDEIKLEILNTPEPTTKFKVIKISDIKDVEILNYFNPAEDEDMQEYYKEEYEK